MARHGGELGTLTDKKNAILEKHTKGKAEPKIAARLKQIGSPLSDLSKDEPSKLIEEVFRGVI
ncbi:MAG: hypothetical protein QXU18_12835 [Thermoplasmatales archaeon]